MLDGREFLMVHVATRLDIGRSAAAGVGLLAKLSRIAAESPPNPAESSRIQPLTMQRIPLP